MVNAGPNVTVSDAVHPHIADALDELLELLELLDDKLEPLEEDELPLDDDEPLELPEDDELPLELPDDDELPDDELLLDEHGGSVLSCPLSQSARRETSVPSAARMTM